MENMNSEFLIVAFPESGEIVGVRLVEGFSRRFFSSCFFFLDMMMVVENNCLHHGWISIFTICVGHGSETKHLFSIARYKPEIWWLILGWLPIQHHSRQWVFSSCSCQSYGESMFPIKCLDIQYYWKPHIIFFLVTRNEELISVPLVMWFFMSKKMFLEETLAIILRLQIYRGEQLLQYVVGFPAPSLFEGVSGHFSMLKKWLVFAGINSITGKVHMTCLLRAGTDLRDLLVQLVTLQLWTFKLFA